MGTSSIKKLDQVFTLLEEKIKTGDWAIGNQIPTEMELSIQFGCSRGTISKAISRLEHQKMVARRTRAGTRVTSATPLSGMSYFELDAYALIYPGNQHGGIWGVASGFQRAADAASRRTLMLSTGADFHKEAELLGRLSEFDIKGAAIYPVVQSTDDQAYYIKMAMSAKLPVVLAGFNLLGSRRSAVVGDGFHAGLTATNHLINRGLRKIGFLANYALNPVIRDQYLGYRQALEIAGIAESPLMSYVSQDMTPRLDDPMREPREITRAYLIRAQDVQGVVCGAEFFGAALLQAAKERGLSIPGDLSIVDLSDSMALADKEVPLTTYTISHEEIGRRTFALLKATVAGEVPTPVEEQVRGELVIRASS